MPKDTVTIGAGFKDSNAKIDSRYIENKRSSLSLEVK